MKRIISPRLILAVALARLGGFFSRVILHRSGETLAGRIALFIDPRALNKLAMNKRIILVSGTNGKTSTTRAVVGLLEETAPACQSKSGANLHFGATSALMQRHEWAVLEIDELHLPKVIKSTKPEVVVLLNLTRDQLHRMHEVKRVAQMWADAATQATTTTFVLDIDDPYLAFVAQRAQKVVRLSFGGRIHPDGAVCPQCGQYLDWNEGIFSCACGLTNNQSDINYGPASAADRNLQLARTAAKSFGVHNFPASEFNMRRNESRDVDGRTIEFRLTKNPASWNEALSEVRSAQVILVLNAREVDGIDTSWIYDVDFSSLQGREIVVTGERGIDLHYRLQIQGITSTLTNDFAQAVRKFSMGAQVQALCAYTAFFELVSR